MYLTIGPFPVWGIEHAIFAICYWLLAFVIAYLLRNKSKDFIKSLLIFALLFFFPFELDKIITRIINNKSNPSAWLYYPFCSLFIPALIYAVIPNKHFKKLGEAFLAFGCFFGGFMYMTNPGGGIIDHPLFTWQSFYGTFYHFSMLTLSLTILSTGYYKPVLKDVIYYMIFMGIAIIPSLILNPIYDTNLIFLDNPIGAPIFNDIYLWCPIVWTIIAVVGQGILFYLMGFGMYYLLKKVSFNIKAKKEGLAS